MRNGSGFWSALALGTALAVVWAAPVQASDSYPQEIQEALDMDCAPPCTICHLTFSGGTGTATTRFAGAMVGVGLRDNDDDCIPKALRALEEGRTGNACRDAANTAGTPPDSDMDGTPDVTELRAGDDPNRATQGASVCVLKYGCGARVAPDPRPAAGVGLLLFGLLAVARRGAARWRTR